MNSHQQRQHEMLIRVRDFRSAHADSISRTPIAVDVFDGVDATIERIKIQSSGYGFSQGALRELASRKMVLRRTLRKRLRAIVLTSRGVVLDRVGLTVPLEMPERRSDLELVIDIHSLADSLEPFVPAFVRRGMPEDFVERLEADCAAFDDAKDKRTSALGDCAGIRAGLEATLKNGFSLVQQLDGIVLNIFGDDERAMAAWKAARRVDWWQRRRSKNGEGLRAEG